MKPPARSRVYILYTGGTLGMKPSRRDNPASPLRPASREELLSALGDLGAEAGIDWELGSLTWADGSEVEPLDSSAVGPDHWLTIAAALERVYERFDGFVVLHGTDTMAYTASALSFLLVNLAKPVVLTGAQRPIFYERNDARQNLTNALYIAGYRATGLPLVPEVSVCFGDSLLRGNRTRKLSTQARAGFASPNYPPLGVIGESIEIFRDRVRPAPDEESPFYVHRELVNEVMDLTLFPGVQAEQMQPVLEQPGLRGLILRTFGSGTTPRDEKLLQVVAAAARAGKALLVITQCIEGRVDLGRYDASNTLLNEMIVSGFDLTPEAALAKLMWLLALESGSELGVQLQLSHRGEQSWNQYDLAFGSAGTPEQPVTILDHSCRPQGPLSRKQISRAILRLHGARGTDTILCFLNSAGLKAETSSEDVRCVAEVKVENELGIADVTQGVRRLLVEGRPLRLTLTAQGQAFSVDRIDLSLLVEASL